MFHEPIGGLPDKSCVDDGMVRLTGKKDMSMSKTKRETLEIRSLAAEEIEFVTGGLVVCKYPAEPEQTCGTKGPGPHVPVLS
jgi:hypothetical protein